jgi:hypothetical protein
MFLLTSLENTFMRMNFSGKKFFLKSNFSLKAELKL